MLPAVLRDWRGFYFAVPSFATVITRRKENLSKMLTALEWSITLLGFTSTYLLSKRNRMGWVANIISQIIWLYVAAVTKQYAFLPASFVYGYLCWRGWRTWSQDKAIKCDV